MGFWQVGLLVFAVLWGAQIAGTALQMRHYRATLNEISGRWSDGFVGSGSARARLGAGAIVIVVAGPTGIVRQVLAMQGRTVLAKFRAVPGLEGMALSQLRDGAGLPPGVKLASAIGAAVAQIDRIAADRLAAAMPVTILNNMPARALPTGAV